VCSSDLKELKIGSKEPENRQNLKLARGLLPDRAEPTAVPPHDIRSALIGI
jgi:hypothetical protein